jgi:mannose-1-phosphate guanylyltransferase/mannose-6-phosphate isomerase
MGYIRGGAPLSAGAAAVAAFVEKPSAEVAAEYLRSGDYTWNSGMFVFTAATYLAELERLQPEIVEACRAAVGSAGRDLGFLRLDPEAFARAPAISIDYAVMEKTAKAAVVACDIGWSDVGSWEALWEIAGKDAAGNVAIGDVALHATANSYVRAGHRLVATLGVNDVVVVETPDAVLVAAREHAQDVRALVDALKREKREEVVQHRRVYRPWGHYEGVDAGSRFQVKRITVKPGARLSLQKHHHRAEHWIVVSGTAEVVRGEETILLHENESTYIPVGMQHRLGNPGRIELELIEVQSGGYLGEDDIVRLEDVYGRQNERPKAQ